MADKRSTELARALVAPVRNVGNRINRRGNEGLALAREGWREFVAPDSEYGPLQGLGEVLAGGWKAAAAPISGYFEAGAGPAWSRLTGGPEASMGDFSDNMLGLVPGPKAAAPKPTARALAETIVTGPKPTRAAAEAAPRAPSVSAPRASERVAAAMVREPDAQAIVAKFGQKHAKEATRAKKVAALARAEPAQRTGQKIDRTKVSPTYLRDMQDAEGQDAVLKFARAGGHLKPDGYGGYVGAPRTVTSPQALGAMRRDLDQTFNDAVDAVAWADPERLGTWYDRAKQGIAMSTSPQALDSTLNAHAVYSAGVSPESELGFSLKHQVSRDLGGSDMAYRSAPMNKLDDAAAAGVQPRLAPKVGEYRMKNDPRLENGGLFGVNDFRAAQNFGYTTPQGTPWKAAVSGSMHPFMDAETALRVDRANLAGAGGRTDWHGPQMHEVPWVYDKAQDLYGRGKNGRFGVGANGGLPLEDGVPPEAAGMGAALREANNTAQDYMYKHAASATYESAPGASTGHVPAYWDLSPEGQLTYHQTGRWDRPIYSDDPAAVGGGNRDVIYDAVLDRTLPTIDTNGLYINSAREVETNPASIARPLMDFPTGGNGGRLGKSRQDFLNGMEQFRAVNDAQEAGAWNLPNTMGSVKGKNAMVLDTRPAGETLTGAQPTAEQLAKVTDLLGDTGYGVTATNRGALVFPFDEGATPRDLSKLDAKALQAALPGSRVEKGVATTGYVPGIGKFDENWNIVPTEPYSGEATMQLLDRLAALNPKITDRLAASPHVKAAIQEKIVRDEALGGARGDIQNTRRLLSSEDWNKALDLMRKGVPVAAALGALGWSTNSLAAER